MRVLIVTQVFWPDTASTAQHLFDLAESLVNHGHEVNVISSRNDYENPSVKFSRSEVFQNIRINRINNTSFGKKYTIGRVIDFFTFCLLLIPQLIFLKRRNVDLVIGMTSPPLVSFLVTVAAKIKGLKFCYWVMDLQPELSIATDLFSKTSLTSKALQLMGDYIIKNSSLIIVLDRYMRSYVISRGAIPEKVFVSEVWSVVQDAYSGKREMNPFRLENNFGDKIVIMYSGNHAFVHPLDTLLETAYQLNTDNRFIFVFVGGGVRMSDVTEFKEKYKLNNIIQLPYQPRNNIHNSLGSADLQVVVMGDGLIGYTHPNKIYGSMFMRKPILYIGPSTDNHVTDILNNLRGNIIVSHGEVDKLVKQLQSFIKKSPKEIDSIGEANFKYIFDFFNPDYLKDKMVKILTDSVK